MNNKTFKFVLIALLILFLINNVSALCIDSDNGKNYDIKGSVTETNFFKTIKTDYCINNFLENTNQLIEYYCENNKISSETFLCSYRCEDGKCISYEKYLVLDSGFFLVQSLRDKDFLSTKSLYIIIFSIYYQRRLK